MMLMTPLIVGQAVDPRGIEARLSAMQFRRSLALTTAAVALATAGLSSCGFNYATDRVYTPAAGVNSSGGVVKVLAAVIVSAEPGSGTFVASLTNGSETTAVSMTGLAATEGTDITVAEFEPVVVPERGLVNLASPPADLTLTGEFEAGDWVTIAASFDNGQRVELEVPVVSNSGPYEGLDGETAPEPAN